MSLPREWNLQDSRGSLYCPSEPDPISRVEYKSGGLIRTQTSIPIIDQTNGCCESVAVSSLLSNCQQSGSLFSIHSAPPVPLTQLNHINNHETFLGFGCTSAAGPIGSFDDASKSAIITTNTNSEKEFINIHEINQTTTNIITDINTNSKNVLNIGTNSTATATTTTQTQTQTQPITIDSTTTTTNQPPLLQRPGSLAIEPPAYCPNTAKNLHANFLQHQISEIEEDDNENLLTVSSITARPLIAKSRELRSTRLLAEKKRKFNNTANHHKDNNNHHKNGNGVLSSSASSASTEPPDGGYGWFIVFGAFSVQFWVAGLVKSYGVLYVEIMETFPKTSATVASWIPAILSCLCLALAPLSSALCQRFSCRTVVFIGGLFCAFGLTLSYFATSLLHLLFTFGILTGIGGGLSTTPGIVIVSQYFDKHRALANGICVSGTAAGSFILPVLIEHLVHHFGFHGTILILGGCMLHVCVSATLYKPVETKDDEEEEEDEEDGGEERQQQPINKLNLSINNDITKSLTDLQHMNNSNSNSNNSNNGSNNLMTNSTYLDSCDDVPDKKYIEHLFLEESKNRINDYYNTNKFVNVNEKSIQPDSDDEGKDIVGETTFMKPIKSVRSSSILHSVEDLSTDSTWVYRKHSGSESNRGSRRRQRNAFCNDELISKIHANLETRKSSPTTTITTTATTNQPISAASKGLSKSMEIPIPSSNFCETNNNNHHHHHHHHHHHEDIEESITCCDRIQTYLDISLLKDPTFILMCLSVVLMSVGCPYMLYYLPAHVISIGYSKSEAGYLVAVSAALDLIGRLGLGWLSDLQLFDRKKTYIICILGAGIAVLTIPSASSFYWIGCAAATYGFCLGCWYLLMPVLLADLFGTDRISSSYGLVRMFQSIGAISVPPLAGFLRDLSGNYEICFYCMGSCMVCGCIPLLIWAIIQQRKGILFSIRDEEHEHEHEHQDHRHH